MVPSGLPAPESFARYGKSTGKGDITGLPAGTGVVPGNPDISGPTEAFEALAGGVGEPAAPELPTEPLPAINVAGPVTLPFSPATFDAVTIPFAELGLCGNVPLGKRDLLAAAATDQRAETRSKIALRADRRS